MKKSPRNPAAFTLIELLVVISIIAILASIAMPVYGIAMRTARMGAATANGRSIVMSLRLYSEDNGGVFPVDKNIYDDPILSSNDAFRSVLPTYCDNETIFTVPNSKAGPKADGKIDSPAQILARGENHWAYISGLSNTSNSTWPLVVDHTDGSGQYSTDETAPSQAPRFEPDPERGRIVVNFHEWQLDLKFPGADANVDKSNPGF